MVLLQACILSCSFLFIHLFFLCIWYGSLSLYVVLVSFAYFSLPLLSLFIFNSIIMFAIFLFASCVLAFYHRHSSSCLALVLLSAFVGVQLHCYYSCMFLLVVKISSLPSVFFYLLYSSSLFPSSSSSPFFILFLSFHSSLSYVLFSCSLVSFLFTPFLPLFSVFIFC